MKTTKKNSLRKDFRHAKSGQKSTNKRQTLLKKAIKDAKKYGGVSIDLSGKSQRQVGVFPYSRQKDRSLIALKPGWRISRNETLYYENRKNRSDKANSRL